MSLWNMTRERVQHSLMNDVVKGYVYSTVFQRVVSKIGQALNCTKAFS